MARRFFTDPFPDRGPATLSPAQGHHLGRLVRTKPGTDVVLFDGRGAERWARVVEVRGRELLVDVGDDLQPPRGATPRMGLDLVCALPKAPRTEWLFEHGTEAGIRSFRPLLTERTRRQHERPERWRRTLIAACAQCDRATLPTIHATVSLAELFELQLPEARFVATRSEQELGPATTDEAVLVIGPEGGLTEREVEEVVGAGFQPRNLGPLTLRTETAAVAGAVRMLQVPPAVQR